MLLRAQRGGESHGARFRCAHAEQTVEHNLTEFRGMRDGKYRPREAFLRMKMDITDGNPQSEQHPFSSTSITKMICWRRTVST